MLSHRQQRRLMFRWKIRVKWWSSLLCWLLYLRTGYSCSRLYPESGRDHWVSAGNRTCNNRCHGQGFRDKDYGQGYHYGGMWYYYIMELLPPWRFPCHVLYGRILDDSSVFAKLHPKHKTPVNSLYLIGAWLCWLLLQEEQWWSGSVMQVTSDAALHTVWFCLSWSFVKGTGWQDLTK